MAVHLGSRFEPLAIFFTPVIMKVQMTGFVRFGDVAGVGVGDYSAGDGRCSE